MSCIYIYIYIHTHIYTYTYTHTCTYTYGGRRGGATVTWGGITGLTGRGVYYTIT